MKLPEPVAYLHVPLYQIGVQKIRPVASIIKYNEPDIYGEVINLYGENQLREALAQQEAVMRMALKCLKATEEYLRIEVHEAYVRDANINTINDWQLKLRQHREAIKALEEQLK